MDLRLKNAERRLTGSKGQPGRGSRPYETKPFQFNSMSVYFQNGHEKRQHDRGIDEGGRRSTGRVGMVWRYRIAK